MLKTILHPQEIDALGYVPIYLCNGKYPQIAKSWNANWIHVRTLFDFPPEIRKAIYTTNAIEPLNSVVRSATKKRKLFPNENSALKVIYLAIMQASKKWTMPIRNWRLAMNHFVIEFDERINNSVRNLHRIFYRVLGSGSSTTTMKGRIVHSVTDHRHPKRKYPKSSKLNLFC